MRGTRMRNFYKVLGIASSADDLRIKSAFRRRAKVVHPDLNPGDADAEDRFRELMQAYQVLRDAQARAAYDAHLVRRRCEARHRFVQSAGLMAASFVATAVTGSLLLGLMSAPFGENLQLVVASLSLTEANAHTSDSGKEWTVTVASAPSDGTARSTDFAKRASPAPAEPKATAPMPT